MKHGISIVNTPGLIDSDYRGELKVTLINLDPNESFQAQKGDRIAQLVIMKVENANFECRASLDETERGDSGFGSSGIHSMRFPRQVAHRNQDRALERLSELRP